MSKPPNPRTVRVGEYDVVLHPHVGGLFGPRVTVHTAGAQLNLSADDAALLASYIQCAACEAKSQAKRRTA